jgi:hypothetical protein
MWLSSHEQALHGLRREEQRLSDSNSGNGKRGVTGKTVLKWLGEGVAVLPVPTLL